MRAIPGPTAGYLASPELFCPCAVSHDIPDFSFTKKRRKSQCDAARLLNEQRMITAHLRPELRHLRATLTTARITPRPKRREGHPLTRATLVPNTVAEYFMQRFRQPWN